MYQSLPNKYRPLLFKDLVGQEQNQKFFKSLIAHGQISRNIVLAGYFGSSKCVSMDTLIYTDRGLVPISEISDNRNPDTFSKVSGWSVCNINGDLEPISQFYYNGVKPCREIKSRLGFSISATLVHPLLCANINTCKLEYVKIQDLSKDSHLLVIQSPNLFPVRNHRKIEEGVYFDVIINRVSHEILQSSKNIQLSFLKEYLGFDLDTFSEKGFNTSSVYYNLVHQIQLMLLNLGVVSSISQDEESGDWKLRALTLSPELCPKGDYFFDEIDSISDVFEDEVCDISVDGTHSFNANGFVSHNTTTARIYARALMCEHPTEDGEPCNQCESCLKSLQGIHPDIMEIDASSKGGKEDIINLVEVAKTPPLFSKHRVIIDDEVQAHSRQAWDALLKLIEEPPPFLTFIFCTTEKDKVRPAILSRCAVRDVNLLDRQKAMEHLKHICDLEGFRYEEQALKAIVQVSQGHPRDLLKNLEQVSFLGDISIENTRSVLNDSLIDEVYRFLAGLHESRGDMVGSILMSTIPPGQMYNMVKEVVLHFKYNVFQQRKLSFNPLIDMADPEVSQVLYNCIKDTASVKKLSAEEYLDEFMKAFTSNGKPEIRSDLVVISEVVSRYIHSSCATESAVSKSGAMGAVKRRREFVNSYRKQDNEPTVVQEPPRIQEEVQTPSAPVFPLADNDKVYAHNLIQSGFEMEDSDSIEITEL